MRRAYHLYSVVVSSTLLYLGSSESKARSALFRALLRMPSGTIELRRDLQPWVKVQVEHYHKAAHTLE